MGFGTKNEQRARKNLVDDPLDVVDTLQNVLDTIEEVKGNGKESDFLDSVEAQACDMKIWIEENQIATEAQERTADNWLEAVKRWLPDS